MLKEPEMYRIATVIETRLNLLCFRIFEYLATTIFKNSFEFCLFALKVARGGYFAMGACFK